MPYSVEVYAPDGTRRGGIDLEGVEDDVQALTEAHEQGLKLMKSAKLDFVTVEVDRDGQWLASINVTG